MVNSKGHPVDVRSAYDADRAAALAGVPKSTLHYWARTAVLIPSASRQRVRLWSFEDLMSLRIIDWLRRSKDDSLGHEIPGTSMRVIRRALESLRSLDMNLWSAGEGTPIRVDRAGKIYLDDDDEIRDPSGQTAWRDILNPLAPFSSIGSLKGPDLRQPRPHLRIVPGKLAGEPHIQNTRLETRTIAALAHRGFAIDEILAMYPFVSQIQVEESIDLERQLAHNLSAA